MTDPQFLAFLESEEARAYDGTLLEEVEAAIKSYNGAEYGDEEDGRSQVVARDVSETTDYMLTSVLDAFVASGRVVEFEPSNEDDEDVADDVTEAMHYIYRRKSGYRLIHDWAKGGLLEKIGVVKCCVERKRKRVEALYHPAMLPDNAIEAQETDEPHPVDGSPMIHAVTLEETAAQFPDYYIPLEEFRIAPDARDLDTAVYLAHVTEKSLSELTEMGFDVPANLSDGNSPNTALSLARNDGRNDWTNISDRQGANRKVWLNEEYVLYDLNGDGVAERLCVHRVGNTVLNVEAIDYQPFEYWTPYPMQGRLIGQSLADKTMDIQRVNTVLFRNGLDSMYSQVAPGTFISEQAIGDHTIDDLLTVRPNRIVRVNGNVSGQVVPEQKNDVSQLAFNAIEFMIRQRESRTGITRLNKGVDEDTLNDTAKGQAQLMARGQQMERYIIRNFAEGVARLFMKKVGLMRKYGSPFQIRVDGAYRQVDPSEWPEDLEMNVVVGIGSGSKQDRIMYRQMLAQAQTMLKEAGSPLVSDKNIYNLLHDGTKDMGLPPNDYFTNPESSEAQQAAAQQQPDPKMMQMQAELQLKQQQIMQAQRDNEAKLQLMAQKHESDANIAAAKAHMEADLAVRQQNLQAWLNQQQMVIDAHKHAATLDNQQKIAKMRPGGALDK